jgi:hypothetical protein
LAEGTEYGNLHGIELLGREFGQDYHSLKAP